MNPLGGKVPTKEGSQSRKGDLATGERCAKMCPMPDDLRLLFKLNNTLILKDRKIKPKSYMEWMKDSLEILKVVGK